MTKRRRSNGELTRDRRVIADLYLKGWLQVDIAKEVGLAQPTVSRDLKALHEEWREAALFDFNEAKMQELAKIDVLERESWDAWERSKESQETVTRKVIEDDGTPSRKEATQVERQSVGTARFLEGVEWCIEKRCKLLGLDAPLKIAPTDPTGEHEYSSLTDTDRANRIITVLDRARARRN